MEDKFKGVNILIILDTINLSKVVAVPIPWMGQLVSGILP